MEAPGHDRPSICPLCVTQLIPPIPLDQSLFSLSRTPSTCLSAPRRLQVALFGNDLNRDAGEAGKSSLWPLSIWSSMVNARDLQESVLTGLFSRPGSSLPAAQEGVLSPRYRIPRDKYRGAARPPCAYQRQSMSRCCSTRGRPLDEVPSSPSCTLDSLPSSNTTVSLESPSSYW